MVYWESGVGEFRVSDLLEIENPHSNYRPLYSPPRTHPHLAPSAATATSRSSGSLKSRLQYSSNSSMTMSIVRLGRALARRSRAPIQRARLSCRHQSLSRCLSSSSSPSSPPSSEEDAGAENVPYGAKRIFFDDKRTFFLGVTVCGGLNAVYWTAFAFLNQVRAIERSHLPPPPPPPTFSRPHPPPPPSRTSNALASKPVTSQRSTRRGGWWAR